MKKNSLWLLPFYMTVATYFYYEKVRRTMRTAAVSYLLKVTILNHMNFIICHPICYADFKAGFYMMAILAFNELNFAYYPAKRL